MTLKDTQNALNLLKEYNGNNSYIIRLKNNVFAYNSITLNDFQIEYIIKNIDFEPVFIRKTVKMVDWWYTKKKEEWNLDFEPKLLVIGWYLGCTNDFYVFYAKYRRSEDAKMMIVPKNAVLTDFLCEDYTKLDVDFGKYEKISGRKLRDYQEEGVKFLISKKKCILADQMGAGKTTQTIVAALEGNYKHVLIVCPASVKTTWKNELKLYVNEEDITIVNGSKWDDAKFTIINYDILDNFYEIPTEIVKKKEINVNDDGKIVYDVKEKEIVSRKTKVINEAMENSQIFQSKFDLIVIDEAHRLSNTTSGRYKIMSDLVKRSNPDGIFELTATPITNKPINFFNLLKIIGNQLASDWKNYVMRYCDGKSFYKKNERNAYTAIFLKSKGKSEWKDLSYDEKQELNDVLERKCKKIWVSEGSSNLEELQERVKNCYLRRLTSDFGNMVSKTIKVLSYDLTDSEKKEYDSVWNEYVKAKKGEDSDTDIEKYKKITEGIMLRQWLATNMIPKTISLAKKCIEKGHKVIIFCSFDEEILKLKEEFGDICVIHNGKITLKKKDKAVEAFQNDNSVKVFIGNIVSSSVGLTLTEGTVEIFNSFSWVSGENEQAEGRIHRLTQTKPVTIYYQIYKDTFYEEMFDKVRGKQDVINKIIVSEREK